MIKSPFIINDLKIKNYDDMMTEVGIHLLHAETLLDTLVKDVINEKEEKAIDFEIILADHSEAGYSDMVMNRIYLNKETKCVEIKMREHGQPICWNDLNLSMKNLIANYIHINLLSNEIYTNLKKH